MWLKRHALLGYPGSSTCLTSTLENGFTGELKTNIEYPHHQIENRATLVNENHDEPNNSGERVQNGRGWDVPAVVPGDVPGVVPHDWE